MRPISRNRLLQCFSVPVSRSNLRSLFEIARTRTVQVQLIKYRDKISDIRGLLLIFVHKNKS